VGRSERVEDEVLGERRELPDHHRLRHLFELRIRERLLLREEARVLEHQDLAGLHRLDRVDRGPAEQTVDVPHGPPEERGHPLRVGLEGREVVLPGPALVGENREAGVREVPDGRQVLANPGVVQDPPRRGVNRGVDVDPEEDGRTREVEVVEGEEVPPHRLRERGRVD